MSSGLIYEVFSGFQWPSALRKAEINGLAAPGQGFALVAGFRPVALALPPIGRPLRLPDEGAARPSKKKGLGGIVGVVGGKSELAAAAKHARQRLDRF